MPMLLRHYCHLRFEIQMLFVFSVYMHSVGRCVCVRECEWLVLALGTE